MKIINIPIEPLEERYSLQWRKWFGDYLSSNNFNHITVEPETLSNNIRSGEFLDVVGTHYSKSTQLQELIKLVDSGDIKDGDIIFFHDLWFPGLESLFYIRDATDTDFKIAGVLHAGTYDPNDYLSRKGMGRWGTEMESAWFREVDMIIVATYYHKKLLCSTFRGLTGKVNIIPLPLQWDDIREDYNINLKPEEFTSYKENIVVFPHRLAPEKQPHIFEHLKNYIEGRRSDIKFIRTKDVISTKSGYYKMLSKSKVAFSSALQETYGIAQRESVLSGCLPLVPDRLAYMDVYPPEFKYSGDDIDKIGHKVINFIDNYNEVVNSNLFKKFYSKVYIEGRDGVKNIINSLQLLKGRE